MLYASRKHLRITQTINTSLRNSS